MNIVVIIQARTGSSRLPYKVMAPLADEPLLKRMVERVMQTTTPTSVVVATTTNISDDPIRQLCTEMSVPCYSGDENDLLDRHYRAALRHNADVAVKIPSDCPLIDPAVIDRVIGYYAANEAAYDFISNLHPPTYPDGQDVEVIPMPILEIAWREAKRQMEREHTTPFIWEQPERFRIGNVAWETGLDYSMSHRWTIDYQEDYEFIAAVYKQLYSKGKPAFGIQDVLALLDERPDIVAINSKYAGVNWYRNHLDELRTVDATMTRTM